MLARFLSFLLSALTLAALVRSQDGSLDLTFNPGDQGFGFGDGPNGIVNVVAYQSDGRSLIAGSFTSYNDDERNGLARLEPDGTLDTSFDPMGGFDGAIRCITVLPDGMLVGGEFTTYNGAPCTGIAKLSPNGDLISAFDPGVNGEVLCIAMQDDGKILIGGNFTEVSGELRQFIARLNADGDLDPTFDAGTQVNVGLHAVAVQPDQRVLALNHHLLPVNSILTPHFRVIRMNVNGTMDPSFNLEVGTTALIDCIGMQDDKILITGSFISYSGANRLRVARLNANGTLDPSFNSSVGVNDDVRAMVLQDDKLIIGGTFTEFNGTPCNGIARLNANGSLDTGFDIGTGADDEVNSLALRDDGLRILVGGRFALVDGHNSAMLGRLLADGTYDPSFNAGTAADGMVWSSYVQPDGKVMIGGDFTTYNGSARKRLARLHSNGDTDLTFSAGDGADGGVMSITPCPNDKVLVTGGFSVCAGSLRNGVTRLMADGSTDLTFDPGEGADDGVYCADVLPDGRAMIGGAFTSFNGVSRSGVTLLLSDGSIDQGFDPGTGVSGIVTSVKRLQDGHFLFVGLFDAYNGTPVSNIVKVNAAGVMDATFASGAGADQFIFGSLELPNSNGQILIWGEFTSYAGNPRNYLARLNSDGSFDPTFNAELESTGDGSVFAVNVDQQGRIVIGGGFTSAGGVQRNGIARLDPDGELDADFDPGTGVNEAIMTICRQGDGKLILGGVFTSYDGIGRNRIARVNNTAVGISELEESPMSVYPNPNNGAFIVRGPDIPGTSQAQLLDALGQQVAAFRIGGSNAIVELDELPSGTYMLRWQNAGHSGSQRVIVAH